MPTAATDGHPTWSDPMRKKSEDIAAAYEMDDDFAAMVDHLSQWARRVKREHEHKT